MKALMLIITGCAALNCFGAEDVFRYAVGDYEVFTLVEASGPGRPQILIGADEDLRARYLPPDFRSQTNAFLVRGRGRTVLVDTGFGRGIFEAMKKLGTGPESVDAVLLTHMHGDHIGGLARDGKPLFPKALIHVAENEREYWTKINIASGAAAALEPYGDRVKTFRPAELGQTLLELVPGISAIAAFGHTPGHTAFLVSSGGARLLIWGDLMHVQDIQFPRPDISVSYDTDPVKAAETRKQFLDYAARNNIPVAGMHLLYPAAGTVRPSGEGYAFTPAR